MRNRHSGERNHSAPLQAVIPVSTVLFSSPAGSAGDRREALVLGPRPAAVLPGRDVPDFGVIRVGPARVRHRLRSALRRRRGLLLATAALCAALAALAWTGGVRDAPAAPAAQRRPHPHPQAEHRRVLAPVRIADAATVRLLRPGDRVDVIAAAGDGAPARVIARHARVQRLPAHDGPGQGGALVVLRVPRPTATRLAGAAAETPLSVTVW